MNNINIFKKIFKHTAPSRMIAAGFALVILLGSALLMLPISARPGIKVNFIDALFTSTSAVCVTGLVTVEPGSTFSVFGRTIIGLLIQIGGLGVTTVGVAIILATGARANLRELTMIKESLNIDSLKGIRKIFTQILAMTFSIEAVGAICFIPIFMKDYSFIKAIGYSIFHSVSSFNNAGFDIFGKGNSLISYQNNIPLNLITMALIIIGGIGFLVILDVAGRKKRHHLRLHTKIVLSTTLALIIIGALLIKLTTPISWLGAFFQSISTRTAGFATFNNGDFTPAALLICIILMVIGASPGSTGGGIKTTTFFTMLAALKSVAGNRSCTAFRRRIPQKAVNRAFQIITLAVIITSMSTLLLCITDGHNTFIQNFFEAASAFGTAGLSTGITSGMTVYGKIILICTMYTGRLGAFGIATLLAMKIEHTVNFVEEDIAVG